jgi:hypothetical protein
LKRIFKEVEKMVSGWEHDMKCQEDNELKYNEDKLVHIVHIVPLIESSYFSAKKIITTVAFGSAFS